MPGGRICGVAHCGRTCPKGSRICGRCLALVPVETKLALEEHSRTFANPWPWGAPWPAETPEDPGRGTRAIREFREFVAWSWEETRQLAFIQADEERERRELERLEVLRAEYEQGT